MRVVFLHIPKTAGQSVHAALQAAFEPSAIRPARVNEQLRPMGISELNRYQVFSGHFDWSALDCIKGPSYRFTILRDPLERTLSFYFYLRKQQGEALAPAERAMPQHSGRRAAAEMTSDEYFLSGPPHLPQPLRPGVPGRDEPRPSGEPGQGQPGRARRRLHRRQHGRRVRHWGQGNAVPWVFTHEGGIADRCTPTRLTVWTERPVGCLTHGNGHLLDHRPIASMARRSQAQPSSHAR